MTPYCKTGYCQFKIAGKDGWSRVETMDHYKKEQEDMMEVMQDSAQKEADMSGKECTATSLGGLTVTAKPKKKATKIRS